MAESRIPARLLVTNHFRNDRVTSRYFKTQPHRLFMHYEYSVWVDASLRIRNLSGIALKSLLQENSIAFFSHPSRSCAYDEAEAVRDLQLEFPSVVNRILELYSEQNFPHSEGLVAGAVIFRKHDQPQVISAMNESWDLIQGISERDQLTINFVLWKHLLAYSILPGLVWSNDLVEWAGHKPRPLPARQGGLVFDKYDRLGDYHWAEFAAGTVYAEHARFCMQWVKERPCLDLGCGDGLITFLLGAEGMTLLKARYS